jgi:hypothetical protein
VALRLHLKGLESFQASNGKLTLDAAVSIQEGKVNVRLWKDGKEDAPLDEKSPFWADIRIVGGDGKPAKELPLKYGYFEVVLPRAFFAASAFLARACSRSGAASFAADDRRAASSTVQFRSTAPLPASRFPAWRTVLGRVASPLDQAFVAKVREVSDYQGEVARAGVPSPCPAPISSSPRFASRSRSCSAGSTTTTR